MEKARRVMKTAVISGGAGGLGRALSDALQSEGWRVVALDLDVSRLEASETFWPLQCDLTDGEQLKRCANSILERYSQIDLVVYNAGITQIATFDQSDAQSHRKVFEINYFAAVEMARYFLQAVRKARGVHLAVSSVAGFTGLYKRTSYAASKHALEGFFKTLRSEEKAYEVKVLIAAPSFIATNIGNAQEQPDGIARPGSAEDGKDYMTPEAAAREVMAGLRKSQKMIPVGRIAKLAWWINRISPGVYQWLMERQIK